MDNCQVLWKEDIVRLGMAGGGEVCSHAGALLYTLEHVYNSLEQGF
jgi:hypothetical protein